MRTKILDFLQKIGRCFILPIAILPIAGLFISLSTAFANQATVSFFHLEGILGKGQILYYFFKTLSNVGQIIFTNLPIIFATAIALGIAKKAKGVAVISSMIAFFVMHITIHSMLLFHGYISETNVIYSDALKGSITSVCGILSFEMGVFGGIIVGLGVGYIHNRFYECELPSSLSFFEGERLIPILSTIAYILVGFLFYYIWPFIQISIYQLGVWISSLNYAGTFLYGCLERLLIPFGLHHVFYLPFWQTPIGGSVMVNGELIHGGQNIFFAQLADPNLIHFSSEATKYLTGKYVLMLFGLPGAALAMYRSSSNEKQKKKLKSILLTALLPCLLTGITEPIEFLFIFACPLLFILEVILVGSGYVITQFLNVTIGLTFSGGMIDFMIFGVMQGNSKTNWILMIPIGILYFMLFYSVFTIVIKKKKFNLFDSIHQEKSKSNNYIQIDQKLKNIVNGLGGRDNIIEYDTCVTRLRVTVKQIDKVNEGLLKMSGAAASVIRGNSVQIIYGATVTSIRNKLDDYLLHVPKEFDSYQNESNKCVLPIELTNLVDGEVLPIEEAVDTMFSHKLLGDGVVIKPKCGTIISPCDGVVTMIYPTKHAIGIQLNDECEVMIHFGTDTVKLQGEGFELFVSIGQTIHKGDLLWKADLTLMNEKAMNDHIMVVFTSIPETIRMDKKYGVMKAGSTFLTLCNYERG